MYWGQHMPRTERNYRNAAYRLIDQLLASVLDRTSDAARIDLYIVDEGRRGAGCGRMRYSLIKSLGRDGRAWPGMARNQPLTDWHRFLPSLHEGRHRMLGPVDFRASRLRDRYQSIAMTRILAFPVLGTEGALLGAVFIVWTTSEEVRSDEPSPDTIDIATRVAGQVSAVLELCAHAAAATAPHVPSTEDGCLV